MAFNDSQLHLNVPLTDFAIGYRPDENGYLWNRLLPPKTVPHKTDLIRQIDRANLMRLQDTRAGANGKIAEAQFKISTELSFACVDYAVEVVRDRAERNNADAVLLYDEEQLTTGLVMMNNNLEKICVHDTLRTAALYPADQVVTLTGGDRWDQHNSPNSDPIADIKVAVLRVRVQTGGRGPNLLVMHDMIWDQVQRHPNVLSRAPVHTSPAGLGMISKEMFEDMLGIPRGSFITTSAWYNQAAEGQAESPLAFVGSDCMVLYTEAAGLRNWGFGQSFMWGGIDNAIDFLDAAPSGIPVSVWEYPDPKRGLLGSDIARIVGSVDFKVTQPRAGYLIKSCVDVTDTIYGGFLD